jgi:hypothetical protein
MWMFLVIYERASVTHQTCNFSQSCMNLVFPWSRSTPSADGIAPTDIAIRWILSTFPSLESSLDITPEGAVSFSRQFSLFMVGIIVLSSVRLVLRGVNQVCNLFLTVANHVLVLSTHSSNEFDKHAN